MGTSLGLGLGVMTILVYNIHDYNIFEVSTFERMRGTEKES